MTDAEILIQGRKESPDGSVIRITATVHSPEKSAGHSDWHCIVHCPALFQTDKSIVGVDRPQALELAQFFIEDSFNVCGFEIDL